jgi:hypothetical protein
LKSGPIVRAIDIGTGQDQVLEHVGRRRARGQASEPMNRRLGLVLGMILVVVLVGASWVISAAVGGASGFHVVDGYWLGPESTCLDANEPGYCDAAIATATLALEAQSPGAVVVRAAIAPPSCASTTYVICTTAGLYKGVFVIFDLGDGSRQAVGLVCEGTVTQGSQVSSAPNCRPYELSNHEAVGP